MKRAFDMWTDDLIVRRKRERKPEWDRKVGELLSSAKRDIAEFEAKSKASEGKSSETKEVQASPSANTGTGKSEASKAATSSDEKSKAEPSSEEKIKEKLHKQELEARLTYLSELSIEDPGPVLDVVVWHDGSDWRCVVGGAEGENVDQDIAPLPKSSSSKEGDKAGENDKQVLDLRGKKPMADYAKEKHNERFGTQDLLSFSVKFYDDGEILRQVVFPDPRKAAPS